MVRSPCPNCASNRGCRVRASGADEIGCLQRIDPALDEEFGEADWFLTGTRLHLAALGQRSGAANGAPKGAVSSGGLSFGREGLARRRSGGSPGRRRGRGRNCLDDGWPAMRERFARSYFPERSPDLAIQWSEFFLGPPAMPRRTVRRIATTPTCRWSCCGRGGPAGTSDDPGPDRRHRADARRMGGGRTARGDRRPESGGSRGGRSGGVPVTRSG